VIGHEFAAHTEPDDPGRINIAVAQYIAEHYAQKRIYVAPTVARALHQVAPEVSLAGVFTDISANTLANHGGTWSELQQAKTMQGEKWQHPILIGQANHVARIAMQARAVGMEPALPPNLPTGFDHNSYQWWCKNPLLWSLRESIGVFKLRRLGQL
jgi:hypothetical protein